MKLLFILPLLLLVQQLIAQENYLDSTIQLNQETGKMDKTVQPGAIDAEKLAWEMMLPFGYKKPDKTPAMRSYEQILMRMRSGVGELSLLMGEFELNKSEKHVRSQRKK